MRSTILLVLVVFLCGCAVPHKGSHTPRGIVPAAASKSDNLTQPVPVTATESNKQSASPQAADQQRLAEQRILQAALEQKNKTQVNYKLQAGDLIEINVFQESDMSRILRISGNGTVTFPLAGNLKLSGLSVPEAENFIVLKLEDFLITPQVTILIKEYSNKQVYVLGEVKTPGSIQLPTDRTLTVLEAITLSGGFTDIAAPDRTKVLRSTNGQNQSIDVKISRITKEGDKSADIPLEPNDTVVVPQSFF
jgi:polysaccharide export outer membrane protein